MHRAVETIKLNDEPDSPEFRIDLSDSSINQMSVMLAGCYVNYSETMKAIANGADMVKAKFRLSAIYKQMISTFLGEDAYNTILEYLRNGTDVSEDDLTLIMSPLIEYLFEKFDDVITMHQNKAVLKYLNRGEDDGADAL